MSSIGYRTLGMAVAIWCALPVQRGTTTGSVGTASVLERNIAPPASSRVPKPPHQGHSFDSVIYALNLAGRRVFLTGDIGFHGNNDILNRCWGDAPRARTVMKILREQVLPLKPEIVFTGHDAHSNGVEYWEGILRATKDCRRKADATGNP